MHADFELVRVRARIFPTYVPSLNGCPSEHRSFQRIYTQSEGAKRRSSRCACPVCQDRSQVNTHNVSLGTFGYVGDPILFQPLLPHQVKKRYVRIALLYSSCLSLKNNTKNATRNISAMKSTWNQPMFEIIIDKK